MKNGYVLHVVSHTHWDREWYLPFQRFRLRLVDLMDHLLALLDRDPEFIFNLDGQTIVLEDYLQIRPENEQRLKERVRAGRILVGPWYQLNDEYLVSGEATIRSLLVGHRIAEEFGGVTKVGYLPDQFGNISQMPQIFRGFGIDNAIFGRGLARDANTKVEFLWRAPDGSQVLANFMAFWYNNLQRLPADPDAALAAVRRARDQLAPMASTRHLLLMNGVDHLEAQDNLTPILHAIRDRLAADGDEILHSSLARFVSAVRSECGSMGVWGYGGPDQATPTPPHPHTPTLTTRDGELRDDPHQMVLAGTLSSRMYLKQENWRSQVALEKWAEPFSAWAWLAGGAYDAGALTYAWKLLMQNHPHDSICGCSVDEVHAEMLPRFWQVEQLADELASRSLRYLAGQVNTGPAPATGPSAALVACNPLAFERSECLEAVVEFPLGPPRRAALNPIIDAESGPDVRAVQVVDPAGAIVSAQLLDSKLAARRIISPIELPYAQSVRRMRLLFPAASLPAAGYATFHIVPAGAVPPPAEPLSPAPNVMENASLRVVVAANGSLTLTHKDSGQEYAGLLLFEDGGDDGDEYRYVPPRHDRVITTAGASPEIALVENGPLRATYRIEHVLHLPEDIRARAAEADAGWENGRLGIWENATTGEPPAIRPELQTPAFAGRPSRPHTVPCHITSWVSLAAGSQRLEITTEVENNAKDHRLRVLFASGARTDVAHAEGQFDVLERPAAVPAEWPGGSPTRPQQGFVDVSDGERGLAVLNQGLPEYEAKTDADRTIALTLLRCVGRLSGGGDTPTADATPAAQCLGRHVFRYALFPHAGSWEAARVWQQAHAFNVPVRCVQTDEHAGPLPANASLLSLSPECLVLSAVKKAEREDALVVRFYNTTGMPAAGTLRLHFPIAEAFRANLNEEPGEPLPLEEEGRLLRLPVRAKEIVTVLLRPDRSA